MLKIDRTAKTFSRLETPALADASITERYDLQEFICNSPQAFFEEIGQELFLIGKEIAPSPNVQDRIDVLALDKEGLAVIIELKRGSHKLHMLQAITYAGMVNKWQAQDFTQRLDAARQDELADFLVGETDDINRQQRIILVAEAFDYSVLVATEWLTEQYGVDIQCCRLSLACDKANKSDFVVCSNVYPAPELTGIAAPRVHGKVSKPPKWPDWTTALANIANQAMVTFFKEELQNNQENYLPKRFLKYRINDRWRWSVTVRSGYAYVWQRGRFDGDDDYWKERLSKRSDVVPVQDARALRFVLETAGDFQAFREAVKKDLITRTWLTADESEVDDGGTGEDG
ncbi:MAG TPA: hypothetical protein VHV55_20755 [Pirellulales bacterium]|jgi:hypothetical protein|nr:hypothetical protein [Pirellulales bacterium]